MWPIGIHLECLRWGEFRFMLHFDKQLEYISIASYLLVFFMICNVSLYILYYTVSAQICFCHAIWDILIFLYNHCCTPAIFFCRGTTCSLSLEMLYRLNCLWLLTLYFVYYLLKLISSVYSDSDHWLYFMHIEDIVACLYVITTVI